MKGDLIPREDHLALHCQPLGIEIGPDGTPMGVTAAAFRVDADGISTNWIEFDGGDFAAACKLLASVRTARKSHRVGIMNVGEAVDLGAASARSVSAVHDPIELPPNPGHALLTGVTPEDTEFLDQLTLLVSLEFFTDEAMAGSRAGE